MPRYGWLHESELDVSLLKSKILALTQLGVPYPEGYPERAEEDLWAQARAIQANLLRDSIQTSERAEIVAMIAYLQRLGKDQQRADSLRAAGIDPATWVPGQNRTVSAN
jgi:cytochrome c oxidase cbb3-type subunit I/II